MIERKYMSECVSSDYCKGWNDAIKKISCGCSGCEYEKDMPSHVMCQGCARMYVDKYKEVEVIK